VTVALADGSTAVLDTASRLRVDYTGQARGLTLEAGQAYFEVAKGQPRPFVVDAGDRRITAHGTAFDVRLGPQQVKVSLIEGQVSVRDTAAKDGDEIRLKPNEVLVAHGETTSVRAIGNAASVSAWRDGFVMFEDASLTEAAAEMNRYVDQPRIVVQPDVAQLRLSGAFRTGQTTAFVDALQKGFPVAVMDRSPGRIVLGRSRRSGGAEP
jgi:transmembrane sensor